MYIFLSQARLYSLSASKPSSPSPSSLTRTRVQEASRPFHSSQIYDSPHSTCACMPGSGMDLSGGSGARARFCLVRPRVSSIQISTGLLSVCLSHWPSFRERAGRFILERRRKREEGKRRKKNIITLSQSPIAPLTA